MLFFVFSCHKGEKREREKERDSDTQIERERQREEPWCHGHQLKIIIEKSLALIDSPLALHITHRYDIINNKDNSINNKDNSINSNIKDMKKLDRDKNEAFSVSK